ncbi:ubiquitin carboxyl-terminal hydrolase 8-like [Rutidosis leptorrhynchoides]|uniref:ubiquitin carboxyl-terminal hydrolase 8-like n=1 Tax=Rutidosis leptorrhynchoides TaxID=125765 RepID=UPI003A9A307D
MMCLLLTGYSRRRIHCPWLCLHIVMKLARIRDCNDSNEIRKKFLESVRPFRVIKESCVDAYDDPTRRSFEFKLTQDSLLSKKSIKVMDEESSKSPSPKYFLVTWPGEMLEQYDTSTLSHLPQTGGLPLFTGTPEPVSLYDCLEALFKEELLGTEEMWYCPECKIKRPANKKLDIWSFPEILIVQLKRFSRGQVGNKLRADNLKTFVDFPIHDLDISKCAAYKDSQPSATYKLYGISNHHYDTSIGDRYTAYAQRGEHWYKTDGIKVTRISEDAIRTSAAYLLFYKRTSS